MTAEKRRPDFSPFPNIVTRSRDLATDTQRAGRAPYITLAASIAIVARWIYLIYRAKYILLAGSANGQSNFTAWLLLAVELGFSVPATCYHVLQHRIMHDVQPPVLRLQGDDVPNVDVFVTCCREDVNVILDTVKAALAMDYPQEKFNVIVLDDGGSPELEGAIGTLTSHPNVYYTSRINRGAQFKSGNLNYGMGFSASIRNKDDPAPFIAGIDADMLPDRSFLRALLPHLLRDEKVALVNPPQRFYNTPVGDPLHQGIHLFYDCTENTKTAIEAGWCHGTGWVVRRDALAEIGGFPVWTLSEDICCSTLLWGAGYKTLFVHEDLQFGVVPDSYFSHVKQQTRWSVGGFQNALKLKLCITGPLTQKMTPLQRFVGVFFALLQVMNLVLFFCGLAIPIALLTGQSMVVYSSEEDLRSLTHLACAMLLSEWVADSLTFRWTNARQQAALTKCRGAYYLTFYYALAILRVYILPSWLGGEAAVFASTGSLPDNLYERSASLRVPWYKRLSFILWKHGASFHLVYIGCCVTGLYFGLSKASSLHLHNTQSYGQVFSSGSKASAGEPESVYTYLLTHLFWPPLLWYWSIVSYAIPIKYALFPPTMPPRTELLIRDVNGVPTPKAELIDPERHAAKGVDYVQLLPILHVLLVIYLS